MAKSNDQKNDNLWEDLRADLQEELEKRRQQIKEINLMVEQSQLEVNKLAKKNATATSQLQQIQAQIESLPVSDVRIAYDSALDTQQRLFVMRGQLEKLQSDLTYSKEYIETLERVLEAYVTQPPGGAGMAGSADTVELIISAQEDERQRLSRQMHDGPAQALSNFILQTEIAMRLFEMDQVKAKEELSNLKAAATNAFQQVRDFIFDLRPMMLDDLGLGPTLKRYVDAYKSHPGIEIGLTITGADRRLESYIEVLVFRAIQEILGNAIRHSQANKIKIVLDMSDENIKAVVDDNGKGFDISMLEERAGKGVRVIRDRVEMMGGEFEIDSVISQGTRISLQVPSHLGGT